MVCLLRQHRSCIQDWLLIWCVAGWSWIPDASALTAQELGLQTLAGKSSSQPLPLKVPFDNILGTIGLCCILTRFRQPHALLGKMAGIVMYACNPSTWEKGWRVPRWTRKPLVKRREEKKREERREGREEGRRKRTVFHYCPECTAMPICDSFLLFISVP